MHVEYDAVEGHIIIKTIPSLPHVAPVTAITTWLQTVVATKLKNACGHAYTPSLDAS